MIIMISYIEPDQFIAIVFVGLKAQRHNYACAEYTHDIALKYTHALTEGLDRFRPRDSGYFDKNLYLKEMGVSAICPVRCKSLVGRAEGRY